MKIAYLAWGSLLWDYSLLKLKSQWLESSLQLPLNFSRISDKGKGRLTLVIDNETGKLNSIFISLTKITNLNKAINQLKQREKTKKSNIGYVNSSDNSFRSNILNKEQIQKIFELSIRNNLDAIIWTDIPPNFKEITGNKINTQNALNYINSKKNKIKTYIKIIKYIFLCKLFGKIKTPISNFIINELICNNQNKN